MPKKAQDSIWETIREEAVEAAQHEPMLSSFLHATVLAHKRLEDALSFHLAGKLESLALPAITLRELFDDAFANDHTIGVAMRADLNAVRQRDPACRAFAQTLLYFKGFHAIQSYRVAHYYWNHERQPLALYLQSRISEVFTVDIHPAARIGKGVLMDHAHGIVIGETAIIEDNVSMLHNVTLGGTGKSVGDRHPKIQTGVMIGAGAKILGNVTVGKGSKIAAGAVVLNDVPPHTAMAGVPAKAVGMVNTAIPAFEMDQYFHEDGSGL
ncbi:MAG TPA: serine O-acetyltransferase [Candidatus Hydrogenedentes bacterium]|nr:serine O-acetyltransferase [Candidatus Hydrogenedentota bacterium]